MSDAVLDNLAAVGRAPAMHSSGRLGEVIGLLAGEVRALRAELAEARKTDRDRANEDVAAWREANGPEGAALLADWYEAQAAKHV
jgi:hypothetical protein